MGNSAEIYHYTSENVERLTQTTLNRSQALLALALLAGLGVVVFTGNVPLTPRQSWPLVPLIGFVLWFSRRQQAPKIRSMIASTEIELDSRGLTARNQRLTVTIPQEEVREVRRMGDGVLVKGRDLTRTIYVKQDLERFEELRQRVEMWAPPAAARTEGRGSLQLWVMGAVLANVVLFSVAMAARDPRVGVPCCLLEACVLAGCFVMIWRSEQLRKVMGPRFRWIAVVGILPVASMLGRAYLLASGW